MTWFTVDWRLKYVDLIVCIRSTPTQSCGLGRFISRASYIYILRCRIDVGCFSRWKWSPCVAGVQRSRCSYAHARLSARCWSGEVQCRVTNKLCHVLLQHTWCRPSPRQSRRFVNNTDGRSLKALSSARGYELARPSNVLGRLAAIGLAIDSDLLLYMWCPSRFSSWSSAVHLVHYPSQYSYLITFL